MASNSVRLMKLLRSLYSVRVILGLGLQFDPNDVLTTRGGPCQHGFNFMRGCKQWRMI